MKKLLLFVCFMLIIGRTEADLISISILSNDSQISYNYFNTAFNTVKNCLNGNIESVNLKDATITIDDMASSASPGQREGDHFNAYTKSGMLPADDVAGSLLTSNISAGTSYVESDAGVLYRVVTSATSKTYTASKDTWVYIDINGAFGYTEQALGAAQPSTPSNSLLLAKVVTNGTEITSITDHRTLSISLGAADDFYIKGMNLNWVSTERLSIDTGVVYAGTTRIAKTSYTSLNVGTAGDYITGASERGTSKVLYVYANEAGNLKLDDNAPDYHDASGNTTGLKYYYKYGTNYYRKLGKLYLNATGSGNIVEGSLVSGDEPQLGWSKMGRVTFGVDGTIYSSFNVINITDNGAGDWTVNWSITFANDDYGVFITANSVAGSERWGTVSAETTTTTRIKMVTNPGGDADPSVSTEVIAFGD